MPVIMNVVDACKYKNEHPKRKVYYKEERTHDYFIEELESFREEFSFRLSEGDYPEYWDQDNYGMSNFYNRHIFGDIYCETAEEEVERLEKARIAQEAAVEREKKKLDAQIAELEAQRKKLGK